MSKKKTEEIRDLEPDDEIFKKLLDIGLSEEYIMRFKHVLKYPDVLSAVIFNFEEGIEEGLREYKKRAYAKIVNRFHNSGKNINQIAESLGITEEEVYNLLDN
jgi:hypothetical protein